MGGGIGAGGGGIGRGGIGGGGRLYVQNLRVVKLGLLICIICALYTLGYHGSTLKYAFRKLLRGGGNFFIAFIKALCTARTFGRVSGRRRRTGSEPHPAQIWSQE